MEATPSWLCLWLQNSVRVLVLPVRICSILRITKILSLFKTKPESVICKLKDQTPRFS